MSHPTYFRGGVNFIPTEKAHKPLPALMAEAKKKWPEVARFFDYDELQGRLAENGKPVGRNDYLPSWFEDEFAGLYHFFDQNGYYLIGKVFVEKSVGRDSVIYQNLPRLK